MYPLTEFAEINGTQIFYRLLGSTERETLVLIHAGVADSRTWENQLEAFAENYRVLIYDLRGYGQSPLPPSPYNHVEDLHALLDHLDIACAMLVGMSMGGNLALKFTLAYPQRVKSLVLVGAGCDGYSISTPTLDALWEQAGDAYDAGDYHTAARIEMETWLIGENRPATAVAVPIQETVMQMIYDSYQQQLRGDGATEIEITPPALERLSEIAVPTLILIGEHDVEGIRKLAEVLGEKIPRASVVWLKNAAHLPNMENPAQFNHLVLDFLLRELTQDRRICLITLLGDVSSGKSALIQALTDSVVEHEIGLEYEGIRSHVQGNLRGRGAEEYTVFFNAAPVKYRSGWEQYAASMNAFIAVVDSTAPASFVPMQRLIQSHAEYAPYVPYIVVANKQDLPNAHSPEAIRAALQLSSDVPLLACVATEKESAEKVFNILWKRMHDAKP